MKDAQAEAVVEDEGVVDAALPAKEDYASVTITLDHLRNAGVSDGRIVTPMVFGTDSAHEALVNQMRYFGEVDLLAKRSIIQNIAAIGDRAAIISYDVAARGQTNIIVDVALWHEAMNSPTLGGDGTVMGAVQALTIVAADLRKASRLEGSLDPILVYVAHDLLASGQ